MNGSNTKTIIIAVILIAAGVAAYYGFAQDSSSGPTTTISMPGMPGAGINPNTIPGTLPTSIDAGQDIAALLAQLNSLKIDNTLFDSNEYKALIDYTVIVSPIPIGRPNPFAPLANPAAQQKATTTPKVLDTKAVKAKK